MNKKAGLDLTLKSLFAIFVVLFVLFLSFSIFSSRRDTLTQGEEFTSQRSEQALFSSLVGSTCLSVNDYANKSRYIETQSFLSKTKLDLLNGGNEDLRCAENFDFLYSIKVQDIENEKEWIVGVLPNSEYGKSRTLVLPGAILYDFRNITPPTVHTARALMTRYDGAMPSLYGKIKEVCRTRTSVSMSINLDKEMSYRNDSNAIKFGSASFFAFFGCKVNDFNLKRGARLLYIRYKDAEVAII